MRFARFAVLAFGLLTACGGADGTSDDADDVDAAVDDASATDDTGADEPADVPLDDGEDVPDLDVADEAGEADGDADDVPAIDVDDATEEGVDDGGPPPPEPFAFVVLTDTHITGGGDAELRLSAAVDWVNAHAAEDLIELVLVLGDIGWDGGLERARDVLDGLDVPYVPLIGDNEVHAGDEAAFQDVFAATHARLEGLLAGWRKLPTPAWSPDLGAEVWLQNASFDFGGVHFVALDWNVRGDDGIGGETGTLHDYEGGTWPWLVEDLAGREAGPLQGIVLLSHIPMHMGAFDLAELAAFDGLLGPLRDRIHANLAGHVHVTYSFPATTYTVLVTDGLYDDAAVVRLVRVTGDGASFSYTHELITVL